MGASTLSRQALRAVGAIALMGQLACGGSPSAPAGSTSGATVSRIEISGPGGALSVGPGQSLQLAAVAVYSNGARTDVTPTSVWQSSDPNTALATPTGLVKGGQLGQADINATFSGVSGKVGIDVRVAPSGSCASATLSANPVSVTPFNNVVNASVTTPFSDCRWTAESDAPWLNPGDQSGSETGTGSFYDPGHSGTGVFYFTASANRTLVARTGHVRVNFTDGTQLTYTVNQGAPTCAITISPGEASYPYVASSGTFSVHVEPSTCSWTAWVDPRVSPAWNLHASGGATGDGTVTYSANPTPTNLSSIAFWIYVNPSNPSDPPMSFRFYLGPHP